MAAAARAKGGPVETEIVALRADGRPRLGPGGRTVRAQPRSWANRPPEQVLAALIRKNERVLGIMLRVVTDERHPWHDVWGPTFCRDLSRILTPRITATLERRIATAPDGSTSVVDVERLIFEAGPGDDGRSPALADAGSAAADLEALGLGLGDGLDGDG